MVCNTCKQSKDLSEFQFRIKRNKYETRCKRCTNDVRNKRRAFVKENFPEQLPTYSRETQIKHRYGITIDDFNKMLLEQDGKCAACKKILTDGPMGTHIDHCHTTKKVRGILCGHCNRALGYVHDDIEKLKALIDYLERTGERNDDDKARLAG